MGCSPNFRHICSLLKLLRLIHRRYRIPPSSQRLPVLSSDIISEFIGVVSGRRFEKYVTERDVRVYLEALHRTAIFTQIRSRFKVIKEDPTDDIILRTACDGEADYIVSGDKYLLSLGEFRGIKILTVDGMLKLQMRGT